MPVRQDPGPRLQVVDQSGLARLERPIGMMEPLPAPSDQIILPSPDGTISRMVVVMREFFYRPDGSLDTVMAHVLVQVEYTPPAEATVDG